MNIIICGSVDVLDDFSLMVRKLNKLLGKIKNKKILLRGGIAGVETNTRHWCGKTFTPYANYHLEEYERKNCIAFVRRNQAMVIAAKALIAFVDGKETNDVKDLIRQAQKAELQVRIIKVK